MQWTARRWRGAVRNGVFISRRKLWLTGALFLLALVAVGTVVVVWARGKNPDRILAWPREPNGELTEMQTASLLQLVLKEIATEAWHRQRGTNAGVVPATLEGAVEWAFPTGDALAKMTHEGRSASGPALRLAFDPKMPLPLRMAAINVLVATDPYGTLQAFSKPPVAGQVPPYLANVMVSCLPRAADLSMRFSNPSQWFAQELETKSVDTICLERLDEAVRSKGLVASDTSVITWLNRYRGEDFDEWLAKNAPNVLEFRNREIARGIDPVRLVCLVAQDATPPDDIDVTLYRQSLAKKGISGQVADEALLKKLWPGESDQAAMRDLIRICDQYNPPLEEADWQTWLIRWFDENKDKLVYDGAKRRFVVGKGAAQPARVESTGPTE
jgi:hypothetical protein